MSTALRRVAMPFVRLLDPLLLSVASRLQRLADLGHVRRLRGMATVDPTAKLYETARVVALGGRIGAIKIGAQSQIHGELLVHTEGGSIQIGQWCFVGPGSRVWSQSAITIGDHCLISHLVDIHDTNSHPLSAADRRHDARILFGEPGIRPAVESRPVVLEDDVWVGLKATILKGTRIGRGAIVAAGSVVTHDVPAWTLVAGNPAVAVRKLPEEDVSP